MNFFKHALCGAVMASSAMASVSAATFVGDRTDFRDETIYFAMTTRFYDGDHSNNVYCWDGEKNINDPEWRGDFKGLIDKLDYIKALGFTAVWITPVVENASGLDYHGYHAIDFSKIDHRYVAKDADAAGAETAFQELIDEVHKRGMKLILDIVLQHTGNFGESNICPMFDKDYTKNLADINASMIPRTVSNGGVLPDNYLSLQAAAQYGTRLALMKNSDFTNHDIHNYFHHKAWFDWDDPSRWWGQIAGDCVALNSENPAVTNYLVECYSRFIKMGVDGFRIDTAGHIPRLSFNKMFLPQFIAAAESANNAVTGATLIPLLTLGIPGDGTVAIMLSALMINGLNPGLSLFTTQGDIMYAIMLGLILVNIFMLLQGKFLTSLFAKVVSIPQEILTHIIVIFCFAGAYSVNENYFDVGVALIFGALAWILRKLELPPVPILLGLVLGSMTETNFRRALLISNGSPSIFFSSIYCIIFLVLIVAAVGTIVRGKMKEKKAAAQKED